ncbi:hypothetical protein K402DRAFT_8716 [Aulographum hederae CBS 113979]|uniref:Uncharacterized protein n=1 Tax=Aulographum hederae CBS 113979 TaxID=1176131 RepID=A0A6G1HHN3_9PEZI|nr:hypothetical protein K402DRAFT_8716 [Aulographum hederae CBS 113979]
MPGNAIAREVFTYRTQVTGRTDIPRIVPCGSSSCISSERWQTQSQPQPTRIQSPNCIVVMYANQRRVAATVVVCRVQLSRCPGLPVTHSFFWPFVGVMSMSMSFSGRYCSSTCNSGERIFSNVPYYGGRSVDWVGSLVDRRFIAGYGGGSCSNSGVSGTVPGPSSIREDGPQASGHGLLREGLLHAPWNGFKSSTRLVARKSTRQYTFETSFGGAEMGLSNSTTRLHKASTGN